MQVAVIAVGVVKGASHGEVRMVAVRDGLVPAAGRVPVIALHRGAGAGAAPVHVEAVLVGVPLMGGMEVAVVEVVGMVAVAYFPVPATRAVPVLMLVVLAAGHRRTA